MIKEQYERNLGLFSEQELLQLQHKHVTILGCGGLGAFCANALLRFGIEHITLVDRDSYQPSNLNRQLFSTIQTLGTPKVEQVKKELLQINPDAIIETLPINLSSTTVAQLPTCDIFLDCLDNFETRQVVLQYAQKKKTPLVHGAIAGYYGQVINFFPGDSNFFKAMKQTDHSLEKKLGNPITIAQIVSAIQVKEAIHILLNDHKYLKKTMLYIDLNQYEFTEIPLK